MKKFFFGSGKPEEGEPVTPKKGPFAPRESAEKVEDSFFTGDEVRDRNNVRLLLEAIGEVNSTLSLETLLRDIVDKSIALSRAERGILLLVEDKKIRIQVARDASKKDLPEPIQYSTTLVQQVAKTKKPFRKMVSSDSEAIDLARSVFDLKLRAVMCAPLLVKERLIGIIYVDTRASSKEFSRSDLSFFFALSSQLGIAVENARLVADSVEKARLEKELQIASEIQKGLLPEKAPEIAGVDLFGWYSSCEEATGDYYDFLALPDSKLALVLCDVSGHGVGPALLTATARAALRAYLNAGAGVAEAANRLQQDLQRDLKPGMFMTSFIGVLDLGTRELEYLNAGHPSPIYAGKGVPARFLEEFEPAFGFREGLEPQATKITLKDGDFLLVYSDGLTEARSPGDELYGEERLRNQVEKKIGKPACDIVTGIVDDALAFSNQVRSDDITIAAIRITGA